MDDHHHGIVGIILKILLFVLFGFIIWLGVKIYKVAQSETLPKEEVKSHGQ